MALSTTSPMPAAVGISHYVALAAVYSVKPLKGKGRTIVPLHQLQTNAAFHLKSLWLFVYKEVRTAVVPWLIFGIVHAMCADQFGMRSVRAAGIITRLPHAVVWVMANLLPFCIGNQRSESAISEDSINKPWRPIPSKRISLRDAGQTMVFFYGLAFVFSLRYGGLSQHIALLALGYAYNDLGGDGKSWIVRNFLNGAGFTVFSYGAMEMMLGQHRATTPALLQWLGTLIFVITSTSHIQDLSDQIGDKAVGRHTVPLIYGDSQCRWSIAAAIPLWNIASCYIWATNPISYIGPAAVGTVVVWRVLKKRSRKDDKKTAKLWNFWLLAVYMIPLFNQLGRLASKS